MKIKEETIANINTHDLHFALSPIITINNKAIEEIKANKQEKNSILGEISAKYNTQ